MSASVIDSSDSTSTASLEPSPLSCSSLSENGVSEEKSENKEEDEPSSHNSTMEPQVVYCFEFVPAASIDTFHSTLGAICAESCVPRTAKLFPSLETTHNFYLYCEEEDLSSMSWKGLNSLLSVSRVDYTHIESLLDRKNVISIFDLPNFAMCGGSEVLASLEKDIQKLAVIDKKESSPPNGISSTPAKADLATIKRALIVTIIKDELKTESEQKMRDVANDTCADSNAKDVQVVIDPDTDDHFFLLFIRPSHILDNIALIRRGLLEGQITARKVTEAVPVVQNRFLELVADSSRCFPIEVRKKAEPEPRTTRSIKARISTDAGAVTPKSEPSTPPSELSRRVDRGATSGHVARRLVEGSLGIRSTVTREQVKKENQLVAAFAAEKKATRQKQVAVANQVKEAFE